MLPSIDDKPQSPLYQPTLIIHGGAGAITRDNLPKDLYEQYRKSLTSYLTTSKALLDNGASALDAACHAVSLLEDDPLFNCGRGSVFTVDGHVEMEASLMVTSIAPDDSCPGVYKRTGAVSGVRNTRHPIQLVREVLLEADADEGGGPVRDMHCHLNGRSVEEWGWHRRDLERKDDEWFWTKRRWDEHRRGLKDSRSTEIRYSELPLPSQGTVGCVCLDKFGRLAVATSTGGLTNKAPGRVGDTPMAGAGFWAESWTQTSSLQPRNPKDMSCETLSMEENSAKIPTLFKQAQDYLSNALSECLPSLLSPQGYTRLDASRVVVPEKRSAAFYRGDHPCHRRAIALSGTGNGDSFIRTAAARTTGAQCRFEGVRLQRAVTAMAGPDGELQRSAGDRWGRTGEGQGGLIGIEVADGNGEVVADFNCEGMWRAWYREEGGKRIPTVKVFRDDN